MSELDKLSFAAAEWFIKSANTQPKVCRMSPQTYGRLLADICFNSPLWEAALKNGHPFTPYGAKLELVNSLDRIEFAL